MFNGYQPRSLNLMVPCVLPRAELWTPNWRMEDLPVHPEHHFVRLDLSLPCKKKHKKKWDKLGSIVSMFLFSPLIMFCVLRERGWGEGRRDDRGLSNESGKIADIKSAGKLCSHSSKSRLVLITFLIGSNCCSQPIASLGITVLVTTFAIFLPRFLPVRFWIAPEFISWKLKVKKLTLSPASPLSPFSPRDPGRPW